MKTILLRLSPFILGLLLCLMPVPEGLTASGWRLTVIFICVIFSVIVKAYSLIVAAIVGITIAAVSGAIVPKEGSDVTSVVLLGFANTVTWLILLAFMVARGFIKSGLGNRVAYFFISVFGKRTLTMAYGLALTDLILSPAMPSITARGGGIISPIVRSISEVFNSKPTDDSRNSLGSYLFFTAFIVNIITASMFITAMAGNPLVVSLAGNLGIKITWTSWAMAALLPSIALLILVPIVLYYIINPSIKKTPEAVQLAKKELAKMGPMKRNEKITVGTFFILLFLWIFGDLYQFMDATTAAFVGVCILMLTEVLSGEDFKTEKEAWDTFVWMSIFITIAGQLNSQKVTQWFANGISQTLVGFSPLMVLLILLLAYYYTHYFFASATAHIAAMYTVFLTAGIAAGISGFALAMILGVMSNLYAAITHYGIGSAPIFFGNGYLTIGEWWKNGVIISWVLILVWITLGLLWFSMLGIKIFI